MASVIRASEQRQGVATSAYNFENMAEKAQAYLESVREQARRQAAQILTEARSEADTIRAKAYNEGHEKAVAQMEQAVSERLATALPALAKVAADLGVAKQAWLAHWEHAGVRVAGAIGAKLARRDLGQLPGITLSLLREALELAAGQANLRIHLSPHDRDAIARQVDMVVQEVTTLGEATVLADPRLQPGECRVETDFGIIDQSFQAQLDRIEQELVGD